MNITEAIRFPFFQHALITILFAGITFPLMGVFIISLNLIPLRFAMMHVALLGGAIGLFLKLDPMILGLAFCAVAAMTLGPISEKMRIGVGTVSGYIMALTLAIAFILFSKGNIHVIEAFSILWGNILSLTRLDLLIIGVLSLIILSFIILFFKEIQVMLYDREIAITIGLPEKFFYYLIIFILGLTIAVSMRVIGALLVDAFVLLPAMGAFIISKTLKQLFLFSSLFGLISGLLGLYLSFLFDIPTSSTIIIITSLIIGVSIFLRRRFK